MTPLKQVTIYTDGSCLRNPGPGGYAAVLLAGSRRKEVSGGFRRTTNNRMELMAAIAGLAQLKTRCAVRVYSDSTYLVRTINRGSIRRSREHGWVGSGGLRRLNSDLWEQLLRLCDDREVTFIWVRGHSRNPENRRCDELADAAARCHDLPADVVYEQGHPASPHGTPKGKPGRPARAD